MSVGRFFIQSSFNHLRRGGQRTFVALLCVVFGVMSLVAMTTMAKSIEKMLILKPYELIGGDLTLDRENENSISPEEEAGLQQLQAEGLITSYTLIDYSTSIALHLPGSGELIFPSTSMGVDSALYPLAGNLTIAEPAGVPLTELLTQPGDVVITRDLALEYHLKPGDVLYLSDLNMGKSLQGRVTAIASDTPNHQGSKIYYSHATASLLTAMERPANTVLVNAPDSDVLISRLEDTGWRVFTANGLAEAVKAREGSLAMALNDFGLLSLLVGGVGIANTMQVLLRRRRRDVAVWKTLGYSAGQLQVMFAFEAAVLGLLGSLLGAALGVLLSYGLIDIFSRTTTVLVHWEFSPFQAVSGVVVGTLTTVIFAMWAIVSTSRVRPLALLRNEVLDASQMPFFQAIGLGLLLLVPFTMIATWVLGSFWIGLLVLIISIVALAGLGFALWILVWLLTHLLPFKNWPLGRIARNNLRRSGSTLIFAMAALFIGVISLGLGAVITQSGENAISLSKGDSTQENLAVYASLADEAAVRQALASIQVESFTTGYQIEVDQIRSVQNPEETLYPQLLGRSDPAGFYLEGADWGSNPDGVYIFKGNDIPLGSMLEVTTLDGTLHPLEVVGYYDFTESNNWPGVRYGVLLPDSLSLQIAPAAGIQFFLKTSNQHVYEYSHTLGNALPQATVICLPEYQAHFVRQYENLFIFVAAMAGLAILAGILLVANSVSLAMVDRRYEIGVLKAIGYSRRQVLWTQVVEYTLVALVVSLIALAIIWGFLAIVGLISGMAGMLFLRPETGVWIVLFTTGLTLLTVLAVTWQPTRVSPLTILNDRE